MVTTLDHLGREVVESPAERRPPVARSVHTPPKVADFQFTIEPEEEVLGLDVAVNDMLRVEVTERVCHLVDVARRALLGEASVLRELLVELALARELQHKEDALLVVEVAVEAHDVRVPQVLLNLDLAPNLLLDARLHDLGLVERLHGEDVVGLALRADHVHATELSLAKWPTNVEVGQMPLASGARPVSRQRSTLFVTG